MSETGNGEAGLENKGTQTRRKFIKAGAVVATGCVMPALADDAVGTLTTDLSHD